MIRLVELLSPSPPPPPSLPLTLWGDPGMCCGQPLLLTDIQWPGQLEEPQSKIVSLCYFMILEVIILLQLSNAHTPSNLSLQCSYLRVYW